MEHSIIRALKEGIEIESILIDGISLRTKFSKVKNSVKFHENSEHTKYSNGVKYSKNKDNDTIEEIFLSKPFIKSLGDNFINDLRKVLGIPDVRYKSSGLEKSFYFDKKILIFEDYKSPDKTTTVRIGAIDRYYRKFTSSDLLRQYKRVQDEQQRHYLERKNDYSALYKMEQNILDAFLSAFLNITTLEFRSGAFLDLRKKDEINTLIEQINEILKNQNNVAFEWPVGEINLEEVKKFFRFLLMSYVYYKNIYISFGASKKKTWSSVALYELQFPIFQNINDQIKVVESILYKIIDPLQKEIDIKQMRNKYSYPDVDIEYLRANEY